MVLFQCTAQRRALGRVAQQREHIIVLAVPVIHRRVIVGDTVRDVQFIVPALQYKGVDSSMIDRLILKEIVDGIAQQQSTGLGYPIVLVAQFVAGEHTGQMAAGGIAQQGVVFRLHIELVCMSGDEPDSVAKVSHRGVVLCLEEHAVAQHEGCVAHLVQPPCRGIALGHIGSIVEHIAGHDHHKLAAGHFRRPVIQFHAITGGVCGDLLRGVHFISHLSAGFIGIGQIVQGVGAVLCHVGAHIVRQRGACFRGVRAVHGTLPGPHAAGGECRVGTQVRDEGIRRNGQMARCGRGLHRQAGQQQRGGRGTGHLQKLAARDLVLHKSIPFFYKFKF